VQNGRCVNCRSDISVPDTYAAGDHIKCASCGTRHKVQRGETLRLVLADVAPIKESLRANEQLIARLEQDLRATRLSLGIGANGLGFGLAYLAWEVLYEGQLWNTSLLINGASIAIAVGVALELANYLFLGKRAKLSRIAADIREAEEEGRRLQQRIRDAGRV
jgi:hypothetical protein